jgi:hypothetical protein
MYTEIFQIEFQVPDVEEKYITFELEVTGCWKMQEIGGGDMGMCLDWDWDFSWDLHSIDDTKEITNWIAKNNQKIEEMFKERIKKYDD